MKTPWTTLLAVATLSLCAAAAMAQGDWPSKPIRIVVPTPAGGAYDKIIRPVAQDISATLKQPIVIDNRPGAGNIVGTALVAKAAPDGYTFGMTGMVNAISVSLFDNVPYDINKDFVHIASLGEGPQWLVIRPELGIQNFAQLLEEARKQPGRLNYATSGPGSTGHLIMEQLQRVTKTELTHVPYKGGAPALQDVLAGVVAITVVPPAGVEQHVKAGKLRVLAVSSAARTSSHPDIPTFAELGHKELTASSYAGLSAPKGTPADIINRFYAALKLTLDKPAIRAQLQSDGVVPVFLGPEGYTRLLQSDTERWGQLIRALNLKAQ
jgi:tripartite-type tricarboxylate transporter receptor subunit TctC